MVHWLKYLPNRLLRQLLPSLNPVVANEEQIALRVWHRQQIRGSYIHATLETPQSHPAAGEFKYPPLGGEKQFYKGETADMITFYTHKLLSQQLYIPDNINDAGKPFTSISGY